MYHVVDIWVLVEDLIQPLLICNIALEVLGSFAGDKLYAVDAFFRGVVKVVDDHDLIVSFEECKCGEGSNVAGTTIT